MTSCYKFLRGSVCGGNGAWGGLMETGKGRTVLWVVFFLRRRILVKYFCMPHMLKALPSLMSSGQNYTFSTH